jgi:hypothetical protein
MFKVFSAETGKGVSSERGQKRFPIPVIAENRLAPVAAIKEMINRTCKFYASFPGHELAQITSHLAGASSPI